MLQGANRGHGTAMGTDRRPRPAGLYAAAAAAALLALAYFGAVLLATNGAPAVALRATVVAVIPGVSLAFVVVRVGRRADWFRGTRARLAALHAALAMGYAALWAVAVVALFGLDRRLFVPGARFTFQAQALGWTGFTGLLLYAGIAGAAFGLEATARLRDERARAARAETLRIRAELAALRARLNPHFLFNTLHTVLGLVRRDPALAEQALQDLGDVLRYALDVQAGPEQVALAEELELVQRYLAIERVRLGDRLRVEERISEAARACRLPAFTVQPLVENAIRYAVAPRAHGGRVRIEARRDERDGRLEVTVSDDGPCPPAAAPPASVAAGGTGLGLSLVRQRLEAALGPTAQLTAEHTDSGFVVTLHIPQPEGAP
jgi:signal transduction histidine kinase